MPLTPGLLLADRYRLSYRIAVGGMGEVWAADDTRLARAVAVKILKSELTSDREFVDRFRAEARTTASLNSSGIAAVYDYGEVATTVGGRPDTAFLVMELVIGEPLSAVLARTHRLSVSRTLDVLEQSGRALQAAHSRALVHRDIKPGNILITPTGQVKITDFGIARVAYQVPVTRGGLVMGTAQYISPEQAAGRESLPPSDVYALGVVAYECLAGVRPFNGDNAIAVATAHVRDPPPPLPTDIPPAVAALVLRMLAKDPAARFPDGAAVARAVAAIRGDNRSFGPITGSTPIFGWSGAPAAAQSTGRTGSTAPAKTSGPGAPTGADSRNAYAPASFAASAGYLQSAGYGSAHPPPPRPAVQDMARAHAAHPAPVNRRTGVAALIVVLVLLIVGVAGAILLSNAGTPGSLRDTTAVRLPSTAAGNFTAGDASYSRWLEVGSAVCRAAPAAAKV